MTQPDPDFAWDNYLPQHRGLIALRRVQARRLTSCTICGRRPIDLYLAIVHACLRDVGAEAYDPKLYVRSMALCLTHSALGFDELADHVWPGWRPVGGQGEANERPTDEYRAPA
jgi:hypothetical protein